MVELADIRRAAHIVIPNTAPAVKVEATSDLGATVHLVAPEYRLSRADDLAASLGITLIPSFDHPDVVTGQGTIRLEIDADAPDNLGCVLVPVSGGGLISGVAVALRALGSASPWPPAVTWIRHSYAGC